jgi:hypothetical protein
MVGQGVTTMNGYSVAALFCGCLSITTVVADLGLSFLTWQPDQIGILIPFLSFLPVCFYFLGLSLTKQQKEIDALRGELDSLKTKMSG